MKHTNIIFHQLLKSLPHQPFQAVVDRHQGDKRIRSLSCWNQLVALLSPNSLDVSLFVTWSIALTARKTAIITWGRTISRSSLSDANQKRPSEIFLETFYYLLEQVREHLPNKAAN